MEITLENIELVKDRTGVSYKEAKEALTFADGNVVDAIIYIEDNIDASYATDSNKVSALKGFVCDAVKKGNVNRIKIFRNDELLVNLPLSAGVVGIAFLGWWNIAVAALIGVSKCKIELVKEDGSVIDITEKASDAIGVVREKGGVVVDEVVDKTSDIYEAARNKGIDLRETAENIINKKKAENIDATSINMDEEKEEE